MKGAAPVLKLGARLAEKCGTAWLCPGAANPPLSIERRELDVQGTGYPWRDVVSYGFVCGSCVVWLDWYGS